MEIREYPAFNADEIRRLYSEAGWTAYTEDMQALEQGYRNSLLILAAYEKDDLSRTFWFSRKSSGRESARHF